MVKYCPHTMKASCGHAAFRCGLKPGHEGDHKYHDIFTIGLDEKPPWIFKDHIMVDTRKANE